jgi:hypothetical protein
MARASQGRTLSPRGVGGGGSHVGADDRMTRAADLRGPVTYIQAWVRLGDAHCTLLAQPLPPPRDLGSRADKLRDIHSRGCHFKASPGSRGMATAAPMSCEQAASS